MAKTRRPTSSRGRARRPKSPEEKLAIVRAELRGLHRVTQSAIGIPAGAWLKDGAPARFIQLIEVKRGMSGFLHALDSEGNVWERQWRKPTETTPGESWWELLNPERRTPKAEAP